MNIVSQIRKRFFYLLAWGVGAIVICGSLLVLLFVWSTEDKTYDRTADWSKYNSEIVSHYFKIPNEASIQMATHTEAAIMGMRFHVEFTLPTDKPPEVWLQDIATLSGLKDRFKKTKFLYDCGSECDLLRLEYLPKQNLYIAESGWD